MAVIEHHSSGLNVVDGAAYVSVPVTAGRRLAVYRGSGAAAAGGTAAPAVSKATTSQPSEFLIAQGGDSRISSTGALTVTGITFETDPIAVFSLTHVGAAGAFSEWVWDANQHTPIVLQPGQLLALRNPVAMDAAGTWQFSITADYYELGST